MSEQVKPGWKTSEAWITGAAQVLGAAMAILGPLAPMHPYAQVASIVVGGLLAIVTQVRYLDKRTELKKGLPPFTVSPEYQKTLDAQAGKPNFPPGARGFADWRLMLAVVLALILGFFAVGKAAHADNVGIVSTQDTRAGVENGFGTKLSAVACNAAAATRWTGWIAVSTKRNIVFDVDFVDADSSAASLDVRCETSRVNTTVADAGRDLPVITATASTGISSITVSTWRWVSTAGTAPGSSSYTLFIENIPAPFIECLFTCGAGGAAADNFTVFARGVNP